MLGFRATSLSSPRIAGHLEGQPPISVISPFRFSMLNFECPMAPQDSYCLAQNGNGDDLITESGEKEGRNGNGGDFDWKKDRRAAFNFKLGALVNPDPDNIVAVGLTGLLAWASAQVLWQLTFISFAILIAALKYTFIAAFLLFILITFL